MAIQWPVELQDILDESGFGVQYGPTKIETEMDTGPKKVRRRFTQGIDSFSGQITVHRDDYLIFKNFYNITLNGGVSYFEYRHPIELTDREFRFSGEPSVNYIGGNYFTISFNWEIKPQ